MAAGVLLLCSAPLVKLGAINHHSRGTRTHGHYSSQREVAVNSCASWCHAHEQPWLIRCGWKYCSGCNDCKILQANSDTRGCPIDTQDEPAVTMCCRHDGFGQQYLALISVYAFSVATNRTFCVSPFQAIPHFATHGAQHIQGGSRVFKDSANLGRWFDFIFLP